MLEEITPSIVMLFSLAIFIWSAVVFVFLNRRVINNRATSIARQKLMTEILLLENELRALDYGDEKEAVYAKLVELKQTFSNLDGVPTQVRKISNKAKLPDGVTHIFSFKEQNKDRSLKSLKR